MVKPYRDGGPALWPRNTDGVKHAVCLHGTLNDPSDVDEGWDVELAFPFRAISDYVMREVCDNSY